MWQTLGMDIRDRLSSCSLLAAMALSLAACSSSDDPRPPTTPAPTKTVSPSDKPKADKTKSEKPEPFDPANVRLALQPVAEGLEAPLGIANAGDGSNRLFVVEQGGRIVAVDLEAGETEEYLDLSGQTVAGGEQGLLGLAFHPDFAANGRLFVNHTNPEGDTVIAEYRADPPQAGSVDPETREVLLEFDQPYPNHNGGQLAFGPDGMLYIGSGDGGGAGDPQDNGQSLETFLGKLLRIDVDASGSEYGAPADNPFVDDSEARPEIWAFGLRNPWRFSFDATTDTLWVADVGQDELEEVNRVAVDAAGLNFGWDDMEGSNCFEPPEGCERAQRVKPVTEYSHDQGCSITGGHVYRGEAFPDMEGGYFFGDYCEGTIWTIAADAAIGTDPHEVLTTTHAISSFGVDEAGELYLTDLEAGRVYRLLDKK